MPSLGQIVQQEHEILSEIANNLGEISDSQEVALIKLHTDIMQKTEAYVNVLKNKRIETEIELLKSKKDELDSMVKQLESTKYHIRYQLHQLANENGGTFDTEFFTIAPDFNIKRSVDMSKVEDKDKIFIFEIPGEDLFANEAFAGLERYLKSEKCLVTSLPEEHPAIQSQITPTIKITKRKHVSKKTETE